MSWKTKIFLTLIGLVLIGALVGFGWNRWQYAQNLLPVETHETTLIASSELVPGSQSAAQIVVRSLEDGTPLPAADVELTLISESGETSLFKGETGPDGAVSATFEVPDEVGKGTLRLLTLTDETQDTIEKPVVLDRDFRILISTDKPLYQPGQLIRLRMLALSTFDQRPVSADQTLELAIADGKGNTVFRDALTPNEFGVTYTDFQLAHEVNSGSYKITAQIGDTVSERTVRVEAYTLPKYDLSLTTEKRFYQPGDTVRGSLAATYFFGEPVNDGAVTLEASTFDVTQNLILTLQGETNAEGVFDFEFELPDFIVGSDLDQGLGRVYLQTSVTDKAQQSESTSASFPVTEEILQIEAIPEGGQLKPGLENLIYIIASYPDGSPAVVDLNFQINGVGDEISETTNAFGLATISVVPSAGAAWLNIDAADDQGNQTSVEKPFSLANSGSQILLRPAQAIYRVGETAEFTVLSSEPFGTAYLDISREGQVLSTRAIEFENGRADVAVDLSPDLYGTLNLNLYKISGNGLIVRDSRIVVVDQANGLALDMTLDKEVYRPGEQATLNVSSTAENGEGVPAALGLSIVDEAVFALAEQDPGFAKLYFMLEEELMAPKVQLRGFSVPDQLTPIPFEGADGEDPIEPTLISARNTAAQATLAEASLINISSINNSYSRNIEEIQRVQSNADYSLQTNRELITFAAL
ncbi:MAG: MG2 domain-containing protein, partial [Chloroflexota bacterium]